MKKTLFVSALAFLSFSFAAAAEPLKLGVENAETAHFDVPYSDLNLSHPAGATRMLMRITFAARKACGGHTDIREIRERAIFKTCVRDAKNEAVGELRAPLVTAMNEGEIAEEEKLASAGE